MAELRIAPNLTLPPEAVTETFGILAKRGVGKALAATTPIVTPSGWTTMGELQPGDVVFDEAGQPCTVTAAHPIRTGRPCYVVRFSDGAEVVADGEHLWLTEDRLSCIADQNARRYTTRGREGRPQCERWRRPTLHTTEQLAATLRYGKRGDLNHAVPVAEALALPEADLPINPYVLGMWLGDGTAATACITTADEEVLDHIRAAGYRVGDGYRNGDRCPSYRIHEGVDGVPLETHLRRLGNKHVPTPYLLASPAQRLALLQGWMDADGWVQSNTAFIGQRDEHLADALHEIAVGLGCKVRRSKKAAKVNGIEAGVSHIVQFRPPFSPFRLSRKAALLPAPGAQASRHRRRMVVAVEPVESVPVRCIAVDSTSRLFLAGRDMVPTHNTYGAAVMVEEMVKAGLPAVVVDPIGVWWGLRSSADGNGPGLPVTILGGEHGDLPLESTAGEIVAELLVDSPSPLVLDLSGMRKGERRRFMTDFLELLYHENRAPLHVVLDEADEWAPQRPVKGAERLLGACEDLVRRGRARGLGCTLITQRPAVIHKDVLTQIEVLVALRIIGPQDRAAIDDWIKVHGTAEQRRELLASLAKLPVGTAWFWSPGWLDVFTQVQVRRRETFDSSATPKVGEQPPAPRALADVDLEALKERMAETIERAQTNDPKLLHHRIAQLERDLAAARAETPEPIVETVEVPVLPARTLADLREALEPVIDRLGDIQQRLAQHVARPAVPPPVATAPARQAIESRPAPAQATDNKLSRAQRAILTVLAQHPQGRTRAQISLLSGYSIKSSSLANALGALRSGGYVTKTGEPIQATAEGIDALGDYEPLPAGAALYDWWASRLSKAEHAVLDVLTDAWPDELDRDTVAERTGYSATSSSLANALGKLRSLELVDGWRASDEFLQAIHFQPSAFWGNA